MTKNTCCARKVIAFQVKEIRSKMNYSQENLAYFAGLNRSYIGAVERAEHNIGVDNLEKIASGLSVPIRYLIDPSDTEIASDVVSKPDSAVIQTVIREVQFLELVKQCAQDRPDLLVIYLERCGCRFINGK